MIIRYSPGKFDDKIPVPVQKKIVFYQEKTDGGRRIVFGTATGGSEEVKVDECTPLMSGGNKVRTWLKLAGIILLLIAFSAGCCNIILRGCAEGRAALGFLGILQFTLSVVLVGYLVWVFKTNIERYLYGGLVFSRGEIYFQSDKEKSFFNEILENERRKQE